jgi:hypothetical protein
VRDRLELESEELAASFRAVSNDDQKRVAGQMVQRALAELDPPLELPPDDGSLDVLVEGFDTSEDEHDFRRARAAMAARFLRRGAYEDSLYEALHARYSIPHAIGEALEALG